jgi:hypothetical protein
MRTADIANSQGDYYVLTPYGYRLIGAIFAIGDSYWLLLYMDSDVWVKVHRDKQWEAVRA